MNELKEKFCVYKNPENNFVSQLDKDPYIIAFNNGTYSLKTNTFKKSDNTDRITMSVGYDYTETYSEKKEELCAFLQEILPNNNDREYFLIHLSTALYGNIRETFLILKGIGIIWKSKLSELLKKTFGDYFESVNPNLFTQYTTDQSELKWLNLAKKKIIMASESKNNSEFNTKLIRIITEREPMVMKNYYNEMVQYSPNFKTLFMCNTIPGMKIFDYGFNQMISCIECCDDKSTTIQKPIDKFSKEIINTWKSDFMLLLIKYYNKYNKYNIIHSSANILRLTNQYIKEANIYLNYRNEKTRAYCELTEITELYKNFKQWILINYPEYAMPTKKEFKENIKKLCDN